MGKTQQLGILGERIARRYLEQKGYVFREANFRWYGGEVDLVMQKGETYIFVEVKLRRPGAYAGHEAVTRHKQYRVVRTCELYLKKHRVYERVPFQIDVVEITLHGTNARVRHFENAVTGESSFL